ncbi:MAG: beta-lactamase induction protein [Rudaea sp.]
MAIKLVAILVVLLVCRLLPDAVRLRNFSWWRAWLARIGNPATAAVVLVVGVGLPVLVCALIQWGLHGRVFGLTGLVFAVVVLYYCWGPRDLERDVEAVAKATDSAQRQVAIQALQSEHQPQLLNCAADSLVVAAFHAALQRWFGVLFWFVLLGPAGALLYRLAQMPGCTAELAQSPLVRRTASILDWAPAHLMALALALASNFDAVFTTWRDYHHAHPQGYASFEPGFLDAIARASVAADVAAGEAEAPDTPAPLVALDDAQVLVRRVLVVWLTLIALVVLGGWFG